jgi:thioredoxin reductase (NADPH)
MEDALIAGGGIAGLQAAIQLGRGGHKVLVVDSGRGRSTVCRSYHNVLGWPDGIAGHELRELGRKHAAAYGVRFAEDEIVQAQKEAGGFKLMGSSGQQYEARLLLIATGVMDRFPPLPGLEECLGRSVYVCPDCDSYEVRGKRTIVMGLGETGARMALALHGIAASLVYVNHEKTPIPEPLQNKLRSAGVEVAEEAIHRIKTKDDGWFAGVELKSGQEYAAERGFIAFGGNEVRTGLLKQLGADRLETGHAVTDPRTKLTGVAGVWAAGDIGVHSEQLVIAMGEGMQAAIWMHKELVKLQKKAEAEQPVPAGIK